MGEAPKKPQDSADMVIVQVALDEGRRQYAQAKLQLHMLNRGLMDDDLKGHPAQREKKRHEAREGLTTMIGRLEAQIAACEELQEQGRIPKSNVIPLHVASEMPG